MSNESSTSSPKKKPSIFDRLEPRRAGIERSLLAEKRNLDTVEGTKAEKMKKSKHSKKSKEKHHKSARASEAVKPLEPSMIDLTELGDLEGADEKFLQKRRLQLQRELRLQLKREKKSVGKKTKKTKKKEVSSDSSSSSSESASSSSSSSSSVPVKKTPAKKRRASSSSDSEEKVPAKKKKTPTPPPKIKIEIKKKVHIPKIASPKKLPIKRKSVTPVKERRFSPAKKKSPGRSRSKHKSPKPIPKEVSRSPRKRKRSREPSKRKSPVRTKPTRQSVEKRPRHSPPRSRKGGLEKGGKILPVKSSAYAKEMKNTARRSRSRSREERAREIEKLKEKKRREEKAREAKEIERREREREAEKLKREREAEREREREEAMRRERDRQRERDRIEREKRERAREAERKDYRRVEPKSDLPSLLDLKTEAPVRDLGRRAWDDRRHKRAGDDFEFHRGSARLDDQTDDRRGRKQPEFGHEWEQKEHFRGGSWARDKKLKSHDKKWNEGKDWRDREHSSSLRDDLPDWAKEPPVIHPREDEGDATPAGLAETVENPADRSADLEEVLSDISDAPDDILNRVEESTPAEPKTPQHQPLALASTDFFFDSKRPLMDYLGDRGLDFEEISDEELEEEGKMGKGIMDVLGADWASLMAKTPRKLLVPEVASSARRRWRADAIVSRIGISRALAGEEFTVKFLQRIKEVQKDSSNQQVSGVPEETIANGYENNKATAVTEETKLLHPLPAIHSLLVSKRESSPAESILRTLTKRALSARKDLAIRRVLSGLSADEPSSAHDAAPHEIFFKLAAA